MFPQTQHKGTCNKILFSETAYKFTVYFYKSQMGVEICERSNSAFRNQKESFGMKEKLGFRTQTMEEAQLLLLSPADCSTLDTPAAKH